MISRSSSCTTVGTNSSSFCHVCFRSDYSRKFISFCSLAILALSILGNYSLQLISTLYGFQNAYYNPPLIGSYCAGLVTPRRSLRIAAVDRFSFIQPKVLISILNKDVLLRANPRNIDIGFGTSNVFANVRTFMLINTGNMNI